MNCWKLLCYIFAISFQLAGALMLIVQYWFKSVEEQLKIVEAKRPSFKDGMLSLGENQPSNRAIVEEIWINRFAFLYIAIGYILGIWGESLCQNKSIIAVGVISTVILLVVVGKTVSKRKSAKFNK